MHRRNLVLRRFGDLSFGLGWLEDGTWVDHASAGPLDTAAMSESERAALDAVHAWFDCCAGTVVSVEITADATAGRIEPLARSASSVG
jgi:hypothetical protein